ncbi:hypothetical protein AGMMS49546_05360 [Spirochaetia bacterium]|nr:hypothetical protein AGMMS49546_05360 [Spirochaetia bacterium]
MDAAILGFFGTYTQGVHGRARGIYSFWWNTKTGGIDDISLAAESVNPSYLAVSPSKKYLYAVNEVYTFQGEPTGAVSAYSIEKESGALQFINRKISHGTAPCHIVINNRETHGVAANYSSGTLAVYPLGTDGVLGDACQIIRFDGTGPNRDRQEGPHAHSFMFDKKCAFGFACNLGADRIMAYAFAGDGKPPLKPAAVPWFSSAPGAGPRHGVFNSEGTAAYFLNELDSTVDVLKYDPQGGSFARLQTLSTLPPDAQVNSISAAIKISPNGRFVYASNRGHDSIAVFKVQAGDKAAEGTLSFAGAVHTEGRTPRDFIIDPSGNFLLAAHQDSDSLCVFRIDGDTGLFTKEWEYRLPAPVCVVLC